MSCIIDEDYTLPRFDSLMFLILSPFSLLCALFIMVTFCIYPKTRKVPGDVILAIAISDCFISIGHITIAIYTVSSFDQPKSGTNMCTAMTFFAIMASSGDFIYNCAFCLYLRMILTNILKLNHRIKFITHILCIVFIAGFPILVSTTGWIGVSLEGICIRNETSEFPYMRAIVLGFQMALSLWTLNFIQKSIPTSKHFLIYREDFCQFYVKYVRMMCVICVIGIISTVMEGLNCQFFRLKQLTFFGSIANFTRLLEPMALSIVRGNDPTIRDKLKRMYRYICRKYVAPRNVSDDENWLQNLAKELKYTYILSILHGIRELSYYNVNSQKRKESHDGVPMQRIHKRKSSLRLSAHLKRQTTLEKEALVNLQNYDISDSDLLDYAAVHFDKSDVLLPMTVTVYAPKLFQALQHKDSMMINPIESLNPDLNHDQIVNFKGPDGGKSGEFFFFTNDNKLVLKTINEVELKAFLSRISLYADHLLREEESLLSVIYGVYTIERDDVDECTHIILQRNICQASRKYINRVYDLKGSEYDREVPINEDTDLTKVTLKDLNFQKLEQTIKVNPVDAEYLKKALNRDIEFLKSSKLMDYSLLIMKVDWQSYRFDTNTHIQQIAGNFSSSLHMIESIQEYGIFYHIAIIDYLQEWNTKKKVEKTGKRIMHGNVDTSSTHPMQYGDRFKEKLIDKILI